MNKGEFNVIQQEFFINSEIVSLYTFSVLKEIIGLIGLQPVYEYTTSIQQEMKESFQQIILGFESIIQTLQDREENLTKVHINTMNTLVEQLTKLGRDDFIFSKMVLGLSQYFKETNWIVDSVVSTTQTNQLLNSVCTEYGITPIEPISILQCNALTMRWIENMREIISQTIQFQDISYLLFLFLNIHPSFNSICELLHGCTLLCCLFDPQQPSTLLLQELFKFYIQVFFIHFL